MPISTAMKVATSISARVCISLSQRPMAPTRNSRPTIASAVSRRRVACQASSPTSSRTSHQGSARSAPSSCTTAHNRLSDIWRNATPYWVTRVSTQALTQLAKEKVKRSGNMGGSMGQVPPLPLAEGAGAAARSAERRLEPVR
ncbi:hypothetical protein FQZ97_1029670 [compost metagenome]